VTDGDPIRSRWRPTGTYLRIADDDDAVAGARHGHVEAARVVQEADTLVLVGAHARHDDQVLLATLERVHRRDLNFLTESVQEKQNKNSPSVPFLLIKPIPPGR